VKRFFGSDQRPFIVAAVGNEQASNAHWEGLSRFGDAMDLEVQEEEGSDPRTVVERSQ
jgi:hypothetical protein